MADHLRLPADYGSTTIGRNAQDTAALARIRAHAATPAAAARMAASLLARLSPPAQAAIGGRLYPTSSGMVATPASVAARLGIASAPLTSATAGRSLMLDAMSRGLTGKAAQAGVYSADLGRALSGGSMPPPSLATGEVLRMLRRGR